MWKGLVALIAGVAVGLLAFSALEAYRSDRQGRVVAAVRDGSPSRRRSPRNRVAGSRRSTGPTAVPSTTATPLGGLPGGAIENNATFAPDPVPQAVAPPPVATTPPVTQSSSPVSVLAGGNLTVASASGSTAPTAAAADTSSRAPAAAVRLSAGVRWHGTECRAPDARTREFLTHGCRVAKYRAMGYCDAHYDSLSTTAHVCTFWSRVRFTSPHTLQSLDEGLARLRGRVAGLKQVGHRRCGLQDLEQTSWSDDVGRATNKVKLQVIDGRLQLVVAGCEVERSLLTDPPALIAVLRAISDGGRRPVMISGDSMTRQLFNRLLMTLRGPRVAGEVPEHWIGPTTLGCWCDIVYVVRRHDDEVSVVDMAPARMTNQGPGLRRKINMFNEIEPFCWTDSAPGVRYASPRKLVPSVSGDERCVRRNEDSFGPVWCDPDDPVNPCLLRLHFVWSGHEGFFEEADYGRVQNGVFVDRNQSARVVERMSKPNEVGTLSQPWRDKSQACRVDCARNAAETQYPTMPPPGDKENYNHPEVRNPPLELAYDDIPALHFAGNNYWFTGRMNDTNRTFETIDKVTDRYIGRLLSFRDRLWRNDTCALSPQRKEPCGAPPSYRMVWLTTPKLRAKNCERQNELFFRRNTRMRAALKEDLLPPMHIAQVMNNSFSGHVGDTIDKRVTHGLQRLPIDRKARWGFLADVSGLIETGTNRAQMFGADGLHWMCNYRLTIYDKKFSVDGDQTGCRGEVDGAMLLHAMSIALAMATGE